MSLQGSQPISCTYLIASHTQPDAVARLAHTIAHEAPSSYVFIHHDANAPAFPNELLAGRENISVARKPIAAQWGTFSLVDLVLHSLRQIWSAGNGCDWIIFLSGQHYPIRPLKEFEQMLSSSDTDAFMEFDLMTSDKRHMHDRYGFHYRRMLDGPLPRMLRAKQLYDTVLNASQPFIRVQSDRRGSFIGWKPRRSVLDLGITVYTGSQWWAISRRAVQTILETLDARPEIIECYTGTLIPDESFFQTLILNAPNLKATKAILHYANWPANSSSPSFLKIDDLANIRSSNRWFARKIDGIDDDGLRDSLDDLRHSAFERAT